MKLLVALFVLVICTASFAQDMSDFNSLVTPPPSSPSTNDFVEVPATNTDAQVPNVGQVPNTNTQAPPSSPSTNVEVPNTDTQATVNSPPFTDVPPTTIDVPPSSAESNNVPQGSGTAGTPGRPGSSSRTVRTGYYANRNQRSRNQYGSGSLANFVRDDLNARPGTLYGAVRQAATQVGLGQLSNTLPTVGSLLGVRDSQGNVGGYRANPAPRTGSYQGNSVANFVRDDLNARPGTLYGAVRQAATQVGLGQLSNTLPTVGSLLGVRDSQGYVGGRPGSPGNAGNSVGNFIRNDLNARPGTLYGAVRQAATQVGLGQLSNRIPTVGALLGVNAVVDQNSEFAASNNNNAASETPAWAVALIVLGVLVLLGTIAISVQFAIMLRHV